MTLNLPQIHALVLGDLDATKCIMLDSVVDMALTGSDVYSLQSASTHDGPPQMI